jgi:acyl-CoA hydrolase
VSERRTLIAYPDGVDSARVSPFAVAEMLGLDTPEVLVGWTPEDRPWLADRALSGRTIMAGYRLDAAIRDRRLRYVPIRLSGVPRLVRQARPRVAVISAVRRGAGLAFRGTVGWGPAAVIAAESVVAEIDETAPDLGAPLLSRPVDAVVTRERSNATPPVPRAPDAVDRAIGRRVATLLPDEPTVQMGPGGIADAIAAGLDRPVRIWSGLVTDAMAELARRDLLLGTVTAGYVWGSEPIADLAQTGRLRLAPIEVTHDLTRVSAIPRFVACNTALQVGLDGSVNVERVGGRVVAGIGGHADYCAAAARSDGGLSVIAVRSTDRRGNSTILPDVEVVSTPRCDVEIVVTEHGVADLRGRDDSERAERLVDIAAPEHRAQLHARR